MPHATMKLQRSIDRLLRSLVGVIDYSVVWASPSRIERLDILKDPAVEEYQLVRNVVSGLGAGCSVHLHRAAVHVFTDAVEFAKVREAAAAAQAVANEATDAQAVEPVRSPAPMRNANEKDVRAAAVVQNGSERIRPVMQSMEAPDVIRLPVPPRPAVEAVAGEAVVAAPAVLTLNRIELEPRGATLRCRVILGLGDRIYSAIAEAPSSPTAEAEIAARVTLDALRAGELASARLEGVGFSTIGDSTFVLASVRDIGGVMPRAGAVVLQDSIAHAACSAVLAAVGPITTDDLIVAEERLGSMLS